jgi:hypothetical protein
MDTLKGSWHPCCRDNEREQENGMYAGDRVFITFLKEDAMRLLYLTILCVVFAWSSTAYARYIGPTASGYFFHASALPSEIFLPGDLTEDLYPHSATLTVHVRDANRQPVDGMPVTFQLASQCQGVGALSAPRAVTRQGTASVTFTGNDTIACHIAIRVDNVTQEIWVTISPAPDPPPGR